MKIQFPSFRAAADFYNNPLLSYDDACETVKQGIKDGHIVIAPTKTDWSMLGEWVGFTVGIFVCVLMLCALCAWVQIETNCPQWLFCIQSLAVLGAWLWSAISSVRLSLMREFREI